MLFLMNWFVARFPIALVAFALSIVSKSTPSASLKTLEVAGS